MTPDQITDEMIAVYGSARDPIAGVRALEALGLSFADAADAASLLESAARPGC